MCRVCVTEELIFIKRETKSPEVQLQRLHQQGKESSEANLSVCLFVAACLHCEIFPEPKQVQLQTQKPIKKIKKRNRFKKEHSAVTSLPAELKLHHMAHQGDNLPLCLTA